MDELLKRHKIRLGDYQRWLGNMLFVDEINARLESSRQNSQILLAQSAPTAAEIHTAKYKNNDFIKNLLELLGGYKGGNEINTAGGKQREWLHCRYLHFTLL